MQHKTDQLNLINQKKKKKNQPLRTEDVLSDCILNFPFIKHALS